VDKDGEPSEPYYNSNDCACLLMDNMAWMVFSSLVDFLWFPNSMVYYKWWFARGVKNWLCLMLLQVLEWQMIVAQCSNGITWFLCHCQPRLTPPALFFQQATQHSHFGKVGLSVWKWVHSCMAIAGPIYGHVSKEKNILIHHSKGKSTMRGQTRLQTQNGTRNVEREVEGHSSSFGWWNQDVSSLYGIYGF